MNERVLHLIAVLGESKSSFAARLGISPAVISHISSGRNKVGLDVVEKIVQVYPQVSLTWLFTGKGKALDARNTSDLGAILNELSSVTMQVREMEALLAAMKRRLEHAEKMLAGNLG